MFEWMFFLLNNKEILINSIVSQEPYVSTKCDNKKILSFIFEKS